MEQVRAHLRCPQAGRTRRTQRPAPTTLRPSLTDGNTRHRRTARRGRSDTACEDAARLVLPVARRTIVSRRCEVARRPFGTACPVGRHRIRHDARSSTGRSAWDQERVYRACSRLSRKAFTASAWSLLSMVSASSAASMSANAVSSRIRIAFSDRLAQRIASGGSDASS
jgi:hypothetical protein